jgi:hypothetical protein
MQNLTAPADLQLYNGHKTVRAKIHGTTTRVCLYADPIINGRGPAILGHFIDDPERAITNNGLIVEIEDIDAFKVDPDSYVYSAQDAAMLDH